MIVLMTFGLAHPRDRGKKSASHGKYTETAVYPLFLRIFLFKLILYVPANKFSVKAGCIHCLNQYLKCVAQ